jgi:adenylate cyclase
MPRGPDPTAEASVPAGGLKGLLIRFGLRFPDDREEELFFAGYIARHLTFIRYMLLLGGGLFIVYILWDRMIDPVGAQTTMWIRILLLTPAVWLAAVLLYFRAATPYVEQINCGISSISTAIICFICAILDGGMNIIAGGLSLVIVFVFSLLLMRVPWYLLFCLATMTSYYVAQAYAVNYLPGMPLINTITLTTAMFLGGVTLVAREKSARREFRAHNRIEELLHSMLPADIVQRIQSGETQIADLHSKVSIVFSDLVGFTRLSREVSASRLVEILNRLFSEFDRAADQYGMHKIKTIGDAYMAVGGVVGEGTGKEPAMCAAEFACAMHGITERVSRELGLPLQVRVGLHVGPVVAGVIGTSRPAFDCWGEAVNLASRLESASQPGAVLMSESAYQLLRDAFPIEQPGTVQLKGIGEASVYLLRLGNTLLRLGDTQPAGKALH